MATSTYETGEAAASVALWAEFDAQQPLHDPTERVMAPTELEAALVGEGLTQYDIVVLASHPSVPAHASGWLTSRDVHMSLTAEPVPEVREIRIPDQRVVPATRPFRTSTVVQPSDEVRREAAWQAWASGESHTELARQPLLTRFARYIGSGFRVAFLES